MSMEVLAAAKKSRAGAASWLTRSANNCGELEKRDLRDVAYVEYENVLQNLNNRLLARDEAEMAVKSLVDEAELDTEINGAADYR